MKARRRGVALMIVFNLLMIVTIIGFAFIVTCRNNLFFTGQDRSSQQAFYMAQAGLERASKELFDAFNAGTSTTFTGGTGSPYTAISNYVTKNPTLTGSITDSDGATVGTYTVTVGTPASVTGSDTKYNTFVTGSGTFPTYDTVVLKATGTAGTVSRKLGYTLVMGMKPADIFNYGYFMNGMAWWTEIGSSNLSLVINGNTGANGEYSVYNDGVAPGVITVDGCPTYDNNGHYLSTTEVQAALQVSVTGTGSHLYAYGGGAMPAANEKNYAAKVFYPNLQDLAYYKSLCTNGSGNVYQKSGATWNVLWGSSGSSPYNSPVFDNVSGKYNVVLDGWTNPIKISGTVMCTGNVVIRGQITGQGTLYVGGNLYIANDLIYVNPPTQPIIYGSSSYTTPSTYYTGLQSWKSTNASADAICFAVRKNVCYGDISGNNVSSPNPWWATASIYLLAADGNGENSLDNHEDAGIDGMWGDSTGLSGTDVYENDASKPGGGWTVQAQNSMGAVSTITCTVTGSGSSATATIPGGYTVIPGSGEDVDGDGNYTPSYQQNNFMFTNKTGTTVSFGSQDFAFYNTTFNGYGATTNGTTGAYAQFCTPTSNPSGWASNWITNQLGYAASTPSWPLSLSSGVRCGYYSLYPHAVNGFIYCNGAMAGVIGNYGDGLNAVFLGGVAGRQDDVIYNMAGGTSITLWNDPRFSGMSSSTYVPNLPGVAGLLRTSWTENI